MCQAFSCIVTKEGSVYWKAGVDSHENIIDLFKKKDKLLTDNKLPADFVRIEIIPENNDYLNPDGKWIFKLDDKKPEWWNKEYEKLCWNALPIWKKRVYSSFNYIEAKNPIHPFKIESEITPEKLKEAIELLKIWALVRALVGASVWDSVRDSVRALVRDSVRDSVWASVGAYIGSFFPKIKKWKYIDYKKEPFNSIKGYPFQSAVGLWKMGLVPSYDGKMWRLHSKNGIEWEDKEGNIK